MPLFKDLGHPPAMAAARPSQSIPHDYDPYRFESSPLELLFPLSISFLMSNNPIILFLPGLHPPVGKETRILDSSNIEAVTGVEVRKGPLRGQMVSELWSYGVIDGGAETMRHAWGGLKHRFSVRRANERKLPSVPNSGNELIVFTGHHRYKDRLLEDNKVEVLVVERGFYHQPPTSISKESWEDLIEKTTTECRPLVVIESWAPSAQLWRYGPMGKASTSRWVTNGYITHCKLLKATSVGGAILQSRLLVARVLRAYSNDWHWDSEDESPGVIRPMGNLLTPPGLVDRRCFISYPQRETGRLPLDIRDPMPHQIGALLRTEKGVRRLLPEELARGLGIPKDQSSSFTKSLKLLGRTTSVFHWEYLGSSLERLFAVVPNHSAGSDAMKAASMKPSSHLHPLHSEFEWSPPDLTEGQPWYCERVRNLKRAASTYDTPGPIIQEGFRLLRVHRSNYNSLGPDPKWLQLLWWEFPPEHWEDLRAGCKQNFLKSPTPCLRPNAPMDPEMTRAAAEFVDELVSLGVIRDVDEGKSVLTNAPLFVVPKEGQDGQWRVIADMLRGGQNECVGQDPVFLPRTLHILDQMYTGGYSAVVDLSKFFYNFPTHADDRPFLGLLHPITGVLQCYFGLPMGAGNSPALASRFGLAFVRLLKEKFDVFQGEGSANCYWTGFSETGYDPKRGYGFVLTNRYGGAVHIWVWVDDFLLHGPTYEATALALTFFLNTAVDCGFLFHPQKLVTPAQVVKYCGFIFDTTDIPCLHIPTPKKERALAICEYLLDSPPTKQWSRLSLAVAVGVLESLSEATPRRLGHTYLRKFHSLVHPAGIGTGAGPYYTCTHMPAEVKMELRWWKQYLGLASGRVSRTQRAATLVPTFGDGSGTGTGGTFRLPTDPELRMWRGKWRPAVYSFPSVWKELSTLEQTLLRIREAKDSDSVHGTTVFYFTDNSGVYWIATTGSSKSPNLHSLIERIRELELELGCMLQVVHVPGLVLIQQGTDGLSRGIWMSRCHNLPADEDLITRSIFAPLPFDRDLVNRYIPHLRAGSENWSYCPWDQPWKARACLDRLTVWFPPPELARQAVSFLLNTWIERPQTTSGLFFVPRVLDDAWRHLSRYLIEIDLIFPHNETLPTPPLLPIPIVVLYLPPHERVLALPKRMEQPADPPNAAWHRQQAAQMRGLR